ncbi:TPA: thymidine kinase, partial [Salmonella enterica]|nr:thymidine kinase [Salmonella enterica]
SSYNYQERGMRTVVYTAEIDDRFGAGKVSSRIGLSSPAKLFNQNTSLFEEIRAESARQTIHCVLVDESQFLTRQQVYQLSEVVDKLDIPVLCYGLRTDFRGELFVGSQYLLAWSDKLVELKTICFCGRKASMVLRLDQDGRPYNEGEQVVIGGNERYVSVCRKHYKDALEEGSLTAIQERHRHI